MAEGLVPLSPPGCSSVSEAAIGSLVLGIILLAMRILSPIVYLYYIDTGFDGNALSWFLGLASFIPLAMGLWALKQIRVAGLRGKGMAIAGISLGGVGIAIHWLFLVSTLMSAHTAG